MVTAKQTDMTYPVFSLDPGRYANVTLDRADLSLPVRIQLTRAPHTAGDPSMVVTPAEAARVLAHVAIWEQISKDEEPMVAIVDESPMGVDTVGVWLDDDEDVRVLPGPPGTLSYVIRISAAAVLAEHGRPVVLRLDALMRTAADLGLVRIRTPVPLTTDCSPLHKNWKHGIPDAPAAVVVALVLVLLCFLLGAYLGQ